MTSPILLHPILTSLSASVVGTVIVISFYSTLGRLLDPRCPLCRRRMRHVDHCVFYDPAPDRRLYHCPNCGADYVLHHRQLIPRSDWQDEEDQRLWADLLE